MYIFDPSKRKEMKPNQQFKTLASDYIITIADVTDFSVYYREGNINKVYKAKKWKAKQWVSDGQWTLIN